MRARTQVRLEAYRLGLINNFQSSYRDNPLAVILDIVQGPGVNDLSSDRGLYLRV